VCDDESISRDQGCRLRVCVLAGDAWPLAAHPEPTVVDAKAGGRADGSAGSRPYDEFAAVQHEYEGGEEVSHGHDSERVHAEC
jgi:hypothetical protein